MCDITTIEADARTLKSICKNCRFNWMPKPCEIVMHVDTAWQVWGTEAIITKCPKFEEVEEDD